MVKYQKFLKTSALSGEIVLNGTTTAFRIAIQILGKTLPLLLLKTKFLLLKMFLILQQ